MSGMRHPGEDDLALLAGGEASRMRRFLLDRHIKSCGDCRQKVTDYRDLRGDVLGNDVAGSDPPGVNWNFLAAEMRANIQVGLEAGACVRTSPAASRWAIAGPRMAVALATLVLLVMSGFYVRDSRTRPTPAAAPADETPVLESTSTGVGIRIAGKSFMLPSHSDTAANQTMSARGDVEARVTDKGSVTINNVYLLQ